MGITNCKGGYIVSEDRCCNRNVIGEKSFVDMLRSCLPSSGNWRGAVDRIGFEHSWICWRNEEKLEEESLFRTGTSCSGIPHYMELLMSILDPETEEESMFRTGNLLFRYSSLHGIANEVAILFSNKKNQQMSKRKRSLITPGPFMKLGR
ncbi:hypothetical protein CEXT_641601 [Caerostris extrusa]|uniref:Uncharacterized protein n=1 Tax=Caerostris extrusa TaxID=172846 RepID=A0AAV4VPF2_CAEEX|nr:hypothetical protein CEXT_641601 [Caerostris extrusa]